MEEPKITAIRNGATREFTRKMWDLMGTDKYGWELAEKAVPQTPKEVAGLTVVRPGEGITLSNNSDPKPTTPGTNKQSKRKKK